MTGNDTGLGETAVEHICFLADVNQLYESALGLYDLTLALAVAQKSQKDPREYMPYLQNLQKMELRRRQFTIDDDLGRYTKALKHLHAMAQFEGLTKYTEKHALYEEAISLYSYESHKVNHLTKLYADYLSSKNRHKEAGLGEFTCLTRLSLKLYLSFQRMTISRTTLLLLRHTNWLACGRNVSLLRLFSLFRQMR